MSEKDVSMSYLSFNPGFTPAYIIAFRSGEGRTLTAMMTYGTFYCYLRDNYYADNVTAWEISSGFVLTASSVIIPVRETGTYSVACIGYY